MTGRRVIIRRMPPLQSCMTPECGHAWRGWSTSCPRCALVPREGESLREFRRRVIDPDRNPAA